MVARKNAGHGYEYHVIFTECLGSGYPGTRIPGLNEYPGTRLPVDLPRKSQRWQLIIPLITSPG